MKRKKTNIKIKHRKYNLYKRQKTTGQKVLAVVITAAVAVVLCVVGYGLGKPITDYFNSKGDTTSESGPAWTPPTQEAPTAETSETPTAEPVEETAEPVPVEDKGAYYLPQIACTSTESLNSALAAAKNGGYSVAVVTLKDNMGSFLYKSEIEGIKDSSAIRGGLSARQICDVITAAGMKPAVQISTLKDHSSGTLIEDMKYTSTDGWGWLDDYAQNGGKTWLSPFNSKTAEFIAQITSELSGTGFKQIILADTIFPQFRSVDFTLLENITDEQKRIDALWSVISAADAAAKANGAEILLKVSADSIFADSLISTDAEPAADKAKLKSVKLLISYTADKKSSTAYADAKGFIGRMGAMYSGQQYAVLIRGAASGNSAQAKQAFEESGIYVFCE